MRKPIRKILRKFDKFELNDNIEKLKIDISNCENYFSYDSYDNLNISSYCKANKILNVKANFCIPLTCSYFYYEVTIIKSKTGM